MAKATDMMARAMAARANKRIDDLDNNDKIYQHLIHIYGHNTGSTASIYCMIEMISASEEQLNTEAKIAAVLHGLGCDEKTTISNINYYPANGYVHNSTDYGILFGFTSANSGTTLNTIHKNLGSDIMASTSIFGNLTDGSLTITDTVTEI